MKEEKWKKIEIVGDIAIIGIPFNKKPSDLIDYAKEILNKNKYIKSVWGQYRDTSGEFRLSSFYHIYGEDRSYTIYKEYNCKYFLDITKVFFSSKLSYEHLRVAKQVRNGETIINMFAGYGPFSILSAKIGKPKIIYSFDINPFAYYFMMSNIDINKTFNVIPIYGDVFKKIYTVENADRIISPLPEKYKEAYEVALQKIKPNGVINLFIEVETSKENDNPVKKALDMFHKAKFARVVRSVRPYKYHVILDIYV
ncbi:class I SAM-dependent methyltransferase family protein [Acidianus sulfidivorans JP7]|uniref:tRNA 4-demethylwyosine(37)-methyltransferase Taw21 n=1 Tax=Acidianus sulfidivorans TaxID=312539 RepID=UPI0014431010|nr:class I SAM-dependent methyltransferase family protein [Acidianus sulfidivorans]AWR96609.2 class I SAM-dependent methyltransferase family protein [Acidianus sulfidivorans JP7]